jgi:hypothetical protein
LKCSAGRLGLYTISLTRNRHEAMGVRHKEKK